MSLLLAGGVCALMVAFTGARKVGLAHYLKPHQYSIAIGSAWTVALSLGSELLDSMSALQVGGELHFLVWVPTGFLYLSALVSRKEIDATPTGMVSGSILALLTVTQLMGCGTSMSQMLMFLCLVGAAGACLSYRGRPALLLAAWMGCALACWLSENGPDDVGSQLLYVFFELGALLVVKIATPLLDEQLVSADVEAGSGALSAAKWIW